MFELVWLAQLMQELIECGGRRRPAGDGARPRRILGRSERDHEGDQQA